MACTLEGRSHGCGPQLKRVEHVVRRVTQIEAEAEVSIGTAMLKSASRETPSFEYVTTAKSFVMSKPDTRKGRTSSPSPFSRANATQDS